MESRDTYCGTQGDVHAHAHDLPPQLGGCYASNTAEQAECRTRADSGLDLGLPDCGYPEPAGSAGLAAARVLRHKDRLLAANPAPPAVLEPALQAALTLLLTGEPVSPPPGSSPALRYIREHSSIT